MGQVLYNLPDGWVWYTIEEVAKIGADRGFSPTPDVEGNVPFVGMTDIDQETGQESSYELRNFDDVKKGYTKFQPNAVLFAKITPCTENNKTALINNVDGGFATTEVFPIHALNNVEPKYLLHFFRSPSVRRFLIDQMEGATGRQRVPLKALKSVSIPVCGLNEQKRIVEKLDALLARIDTAIEHLKHSLELNDQLFASSLNQAFNPLNAEAQSDGTYRLPEGWKWKYLSDVCDMEKTTILPRAEKQYFYVGLEHIESNSGRVYIDEFTQGSSILSTKVQFLRNDVLYGKLRPYLNKVGIAGKEGIASTEIIPLTCLPEVSAQYLSSFLRTPFFVNWAVNNCSGARMPRVTTNFIKKLAKAPVCSGAKQAEITSFLESLSNKTQTNKNFLQQKLEKLQQLKVSLLDSAFRGEL